MAYEHDDGLPCTFCPDEPSLGHNPPSLLPCVGRLGSGPRLVGRIGSGVQVSASFQKNSPLGSKDVRNGFFYSGSVSVRFSKKNSDSVQNEFGCFGSKTRFGLDITVIYYSRNSKYYSNSG